MKHKLIPWNQLNEDRTLSLALLIIYIVLIVTRSPEIIWPGRFWAEEGNVYFREAYLHSPWQVITTTNLGYYSLWNKLASIAAAHTVSLQFAPIVTMLFALVMQVVPICLLLTAQIKNINSFTYKSVATGLILFCQPNQEVWLNTINSQFFLCVSAAIILISYSSNSLIYAFRITTLIIAGLTGIVSCLLLPFFCIEYIYTKNRSKLYETITLSVTTIIQILITINLNQRDAYWDINLTSFVLFNKQWILAILGSDAANYVASLVTSHQLLSINWLVMVALLPYAIITLGLVLYGNRHALLLLFSSIFIALTSFIYSPEAQLNDSLMVLSTFPASRYFYAPNVLLALAFLILLKQPLQATPIMMRTFRTLSIALIILMLTNGAYDFFSGKQILRPKWLFNGYSWPTEVQKWENGETDILHIWPRGWTMVLPKKP